MMKFHKSLSNSLTKTQRKDKFNLALLNSCLSLKKMLRNMIANTRNLETSQPNPNTSIIMDPTTRGVLV